jgi:hypothetical protein
MSYLDRKNILSEGFFDSLKKFFKDRKNMTKQEKKLFRDPGVRKAWKEFKSSEDELYTSLNKTRKRLGLPPIEY